MAQHESEVTPKARSDSKYVVLCGVYDSCLSFLFKECQREGKACASKKVSMIFDSVSHAELCSGMTTPVIRKFSPLIQSALNSF
jgi:hypothetical protein